MYFFIFLKQQTERVGATDKVHAEQRRNHPSPPHRSRRDETNQLPNPRYMHMNGQSDYFKQELLLHLMKPVIFFLGHISPFKSKEKTKELYFA